jgi:hypothetical protein
LSAGFSAAGGMAAGGVAAGAAGVELNKSFAGGVAGAFSSFGSGTGGCAASGARVLGNDGAGVISTGRSTFEGFCVGMLGSAGVGEPSIFGGASCSGAAFLDDLGASLGAVLSLDTLPHESHPPHDWHESLSTTTSYPPQQPLQPPPQQLPP